VNIRYFVLGKSTLHYSLKTLIPLNHRLRTAKFSVRFPTVISHISRLEKMPKSRFLCEKMRCETLYKNCMKKSLLRFVDGFLVIGMNILLLFSIIKMLERLFCDAYISAWENDNALSFFLWKMRCLKFYEQYLR